MQKFRAFFSLLSVCAVALVALSCAGGSGRGSDEHLPGIATLLVTVRAESKTGWQDPRTQSDYTGLRPGEAKAFETIDYSNVDEIVVWVEPLSDQSAAIITSAGNISIDLRAPRRELIVAGRGSIWDFRNATGRTVNVFLRTENGEIVSLGPMPGPGRSVSPRVQGLVEVMAADQPEPLARVYVAPTAFVRLASTRQPVRFFAVSSGRARIVTWHPRLPGTAIEVNIVPGKETRATVTIGVNSLPKVP